MASLSADDDDDAADYRLLSACAAGNEAEVAALLDAGVDAAQYDATTGASALMLAAARGCEGACAALLRAGAPWNATDQRGKCAGEYALDGGHQQIVDIIVNHAVQCEMLLGAAGRNARLQPLRLAASAAPAADAAPGGAAPAADAAPGGADAAAGESAQYLSREVRYDGDRLLDEADDAVMMAWESPLMQAHAKHLCGDGKDRRVLNIGFGMAIIDGYIQEAGCKAHCIIEAHPTVAARARRDGWDTRATLVEGRWQDVLAPGGRARAHGPWDAIFYDAYAEDYSDMRELHAMLPELLAPGGVYSFFNGLCPDNLFFHGVVCQVVQLELADLGLSCEFLPVPIEVAEDEWKGVARKYWHNRETYYLPLAVLQAAD